METGEATLFPLVQYSNHRLSRLGIEVAVGMREIGCFVIAMPFLVNHLVEFGYLNSKDPLKTWIEADEPKEWVIKALYTISPAGSRPLEK